MNLRVVRFGLALLFGAAGGDLCYANCTALHALAQQHANDMARRNSLAGHLQPAGTQVNVAVQTNVNVGAAQIAERLIEKFDHEPELKARVAQALVVGGQ